MRNAEFVDNDDRPSPVGEYFRRPAVIENGRCNTARHVSSAESTGYKYFVSGPKIECIENEPQGPGAAGGDKTIATEEIADHFIVGSAGISSLIWHLQAYRLTYHIIDLS